MKKHSTSKAKLIRTHSVVEIDHADIITWLRGRGELPNDAKNILVAFNVYHDDVIFPVVDRDIEVTVERPIVVTWTVETIDETGF